MMQQYNQLDLNSFISVKPWKQTKNCTIFLRSYYGQIAIGSTGFCYSEAIHMNSLIYSQQSLFP